MTFWDVLAKFYHHGGIAWTLLLLVIILLLWLIAHPSIVKEWNVIFSTWIAAIVPKKRKKVFEKRLDFTVDSAKNKLTEECPEYMNRFLPYKIKVEWVDENDSLESIISDNQVIVYVPSYKNEAQQAISVLHSYCSTGFAEKAKVYMNNNDKNAADLVITQRLASHSGHSVFDYFNREYLPAYLKNNSSILTEFERLRRIDKDGLFMPVLMNEIDKYASSVYPSDPCQETDTIIKGFIDFVYSIAKKGPGEKVNLHYSTNGINVLIILAIADGNTHYMNHVNSAEKHIKDKSIETIYVLASGKKTHWAKDIAEMIYKRNPQDVFEPKETIYRRYSRSVEGVGSICYEINIK